MNLQPLPKLSPRARFVLNILFEVLIFMLFVTAAIQMLGAWGAGLLGLLMGAVRLFLPQPVLATAECVKCSHTNADHHGNCQECLRIGVRSDRDAGLVPCSKFRRGKAPTPWRTFAARRAAGGFRAR